MTRKQKNSGKKLPSNHLESEILRVFHQKPKKRLNAKQLIKLLGVTNSRNAVDDALNRLRQREKLSRLQNGKYRLLNKSVPGSSQEWMETTEGFVDMTRSGAAYIICDDFEQDIYVPAKRLKQSMHGDKVTVQITKQYRNRLEGQVVDVLEHATDRFIGDFHHNKNFGFVVPDDAMVPFDIYIHPKNQGDAQDGSKVLVKVVDWPDKPGKNPLGQIVRVLDDLDRHEITMESILINQGFDMQFPQGVQVEADALEKSIDRGEIRMRKDFRSIPTFTIDPITAKDFDDALSIRTLKNGNVEVGIHIADVTHYVRPGSAIDQEALRRSTSVYLVDRVAPMLPEVLSNELCSLRPREDSLTFSAVFEFNENHKIVSRWFGKTVIHSDRRFTYEEAQEILDGGESPFGGDLRRLNTLAKSLRKLRFKLGAIAFESPELQFELDENNHPVAIKVKERKDAHLLVEDFMLLANREVAFFMSKKDQPPVPFVYRVHDEPNPEKLADYAAFVGELGFQFHVQSAKEIRRSFNRLHKAARKDEVLAFAEPLAVRTMAKAIYTTDNIGHFGLNFVYYTHFTSPIRRYADVLVHRLLFKNLEGTYRAKKDALEVQCQHISNQERKAQVAERESVKFKQVEYIADYVGQEYFGIISGMIDRGFFVALLDTQIEGLVGFNNLDGSYKVEESRLSANGRRAGDKIKVGDRVKVRITAARIEDREVDMELVEFV